MPTFGHTATDGTAGDDLSDEIHFCRHQMDSVDGVGVSMHAFVYRAVGGSCKMKCAIYDDSLNLVANGVTEEITVNWGAAAWTTFNFTGTPPALIADAYYHLCVWADSADAAGWGRVHAGAGPFVFGDFLAYNNYPAVLVKDETFANFEGLVYCTYKLVAAANPMIGKPLISHDIIKKAKIR